MKIVLWGTYDTGKPRVRILREGLQRAGFDVLECHTGIWDTVPDKSQISGPARWLRQLLRLLAAYPGLLWRYLRLPAHNLVLVSYPGLVDILVIRCFAWARRTPVVWDVFLSTYDTVVEDRQLLTAQSFAARLLQICEGLAIKAADEIFMDTQANARRLEALYKLPDERCGSVWVGVEQDVFPRATSPVSIPQTTAPKPIRILFYGQFIPLHGIEYIIEAARKLCHAPVEWVLIGRGQESDRIQDLLNKEPLPSLRWLDWVDYSELAEWIRSADLCLGIFGTSEKAASVIPNKVFQIVSVGKPLVTRNSPAIRELLRDDPPCVFLVREGDGEALAHAVQTFLNHRQTDRSLSCYHNLAERIDATAVGAQFTEFLRTRSGLRNEPRYDTFLGPEAPELGWVPAPRYLLRRQRVLQSFRDLPPGRLVEVGPGAGALLVELAGAGFQCEGLESSTEARSLARALFGKYQVAVKISGTPGTRWENRFDHLCAFDVLEHIAEDSTALQTWSDWLKP